MRIFDDRLEIWNPGLLPPPLTLEKLKGKHDSVPRNPLIAKAFFWIKYAEDVGSGTSKIIQWCKEWGLPEPTYEEAGASFVTVFHNPKPEDGGQQGGQKITPKQAMVLDLIRRNPLISRHDIASKLEINDSVVRKHLDALKAKGVLKRVGPDKGGHWEVVAWK